MELRDLHRLYGGELHGDPDVRIARVMPLRRAEAGDLSSISTRAGRSEALLKRVSGVFAPPSFKSDGEGLNLLVGDDYERAFEHAYRYFIAMADYFSGEHDQSEASSKAQVHPTARLARGCVIGSGAVIDEYALLLPGVVIGSGARIGMGSIIGAHCIIGHGCLIGRTCSIEAGAVLGLDSTSFRPGVSGWTRSLEEGGLTLEDWVQIGSQTIIERGSGDSTIVGRGAMLGAQVYVGHGARIGENSLIVAQSGIGGFTSIGEGVTIMARVAVNSGAQIGRGAIIDGGSVVFSKVEEFAHVFGTPARPRRQALRSLAGASEISRLKRRLKKLEALLHGKPITSNTVTNTD